MNSKDDHSDRKRSGVNKNRQRLRSWLKALGRAFGPLKAKPRLNSSCNDGNSISGCLSPRNGGNLRYSVTYERMRGSHVPILPPQLDGHRYTPRFLRVKRIRV
jgi:hypothetical protein